MTFIDLSHPVFPGMPVYPGDEPTAFTPTATIKRDGYAGRRVAFDTHAGTHVDAPAHLISGGATLDRMPLSAFAGPAVVIDLSERATGEISPGELEPFRGQVERADFVLFRTGWSRFWGAPGYDAGYPVLSTGAAAWLAALRLKGIGVDAPSADAPGSRDLPVHRLLLGGGMVVVENLANLEALPDAPFTFLCLPLALAEAEGAPARAAALIGGPGALTPPKPGA